MKGPTPGRLRQYARRCLGLGGYLARPGDGRVRPRVPAQSLMWALIIGEVLREGAYHAIETLVRSSARRALRVGCQFGDDCLAYFTERLDAGPSRRALGGTLRRAKRNKAFDDRRFIGLALDGTGTARVGEASCPLCRPRYGTDQKNVASYGHDLSAIAVVGTGIVLPLDVEPYGPGDSELAASQRLLRRAVEELGPRFAQYVVGDALYAAAPFLNAARQLGLRAIVRLKTNLPELHAAAEARFSGSPPSFVFEEAGERVELWDAEDFDPWEGLDWATVRVLRYRQHRRDGTTVEAYWLTDFPSAQVGSRSLYGMAKSRWQIENGVFNDGKNRHGLERIRHHHPNSLLIGWLVVCLALSLERLYRLRYLRRGGRRPRTAIELLRLLRLSLGRKEVLDDS